MIFDVFDIYKLTSFIARLLRDTPWLTFDHFERQKCHKSQLFEVFQKLSRILRRHLPCTFEVISSTFVITFTRWGAISWTKESLQWPTLTKRRTSPNRHLTPFPGSSLLIFAHPAHRVGQNSIIIFHGAKHSPSLLSCGPSAILILSTLRHFQRQSYLS